VAVQRVARGRAGRRQAVALFNERELAAMKAQLEAELQHQEAERRRAHARALLELNLHRGQKAIQIQRIARGFLGRRACEQRKHVCAEMEKTKAKAEAAAKAKAAKDAAAARKQAAVKAETAALNIQRVARGRVGRNAANEAAAARKQAAVKAEAAALNIQRVARGCVGRNAANEAAAARKQAAVKAEAAALNIQRVARGRVGRNAASEAAAARKQAAVKAEAAALNIQRVAAAQKKKEEEEEQQRREAAAARQKAAEEARNSAAEEERLLQEAECTPCPKRDTAATAQVNIVMRNAREDRRRAATSIQAAYRGRRERNSKARASNSQPTYVVNKIPYPGPGFRYYCGDFVVGRECQAAAHCNCAHETPLSRTSKPGGGLGFEDLLATPLAIDNYTRTDGFKSSLTASTSNNDDVFAQYERQQIAKAPARRRHRCRANSSRPVCDIGFDDLDATSVSALARMKKTPSKVGIENLAGDRGKAGTNGKLAVAAAGGHADGAKHGAPANAVARRRAVANAALASMQRHRQTRRKRERRSSSYLPHDDGVAGRLGAGVALAARRRSVEVGSLMAQHRHEQGVRHQRVISRLDAAAVGVPAPRENHSAPSHSSGQHHVFGATNTHQAQYERSNGARRPLEGRRAPGGGLRAHRAATIHAWEHRSARKMVGGHQRHGTPSNDSSRGEFMAAGSRRPAVEQHGGGSSGCEKTKRRRRRGTLLPSLL